MRILRVVGVGWLMGLIRVGLWRMSLIRAGLGGGNLLAKDLRALFFDETSQVFKAGVEILILAVVLEVAITALCEGAHKDFLDLGVAFELVEWDIAFEGEALSLIHISEPTRRLT